MSVVKHALKLVPVNRVGGRSGNEIDVQLAIAAGEYRRIGKGLAGMVSLCARVYTGDRYAQDNYVRESDAFSIAIELFVSLLVSHMRTLRATRHNPTLSRASVGYLVGFCGAGELTRTTVPVTSESDGLTITLSDSVTPLKISL